MTLDHFLWLFYELCHKDFNYILSSWVRKMHDKNNKIQAFALLSCPSMCHVFLICLWNYDHFALCIPHGCHLQFSTQSWTAGMMHLTLSLALVFSNSLSLSTHSLRSVCMMSLKYILLKTSKWYIHIFLQSKHEIPFK